MKMTVRGIIFFAIYLFLVTLPLDTTVPIRVDQDYAVQWRDG